MDPDSFFKSARRIPRDPIFALTEKYNHDESPLKVNLGQGAYRDENGSPWTLPSVAEARRRLASGKLDHEYLPILGLTEFRMAACKLALGLKTFAATRHRVSFFERFVYDALILVKDFEHSESLRNRRSSFSGRTDQILQFSEFSSLDS
jgi:hypothetical protein